jgi:hypothetical protein
LLFQARQESKGCWQNSHQFKKYNGNLRSKPLLFVSADISEPLDDRLFAFLFPFKKARPLVVWINYVAVWNHQVYGQSIGEMIKRQRKGWQNGATYGRKTSKRTP